MLPAKALCNTDPTPLGIRQNTQYTRLFRIKVVFWNALQKWLGENDVAVSEIRYK